ncbi:tripartite tricarboxylate transporter substrate binding protein [Jonquetella anthropi]|uniref:tripartite tricarboxylate transporter substrate binding protein n=1 Tax=Jonquetella anthropi TaxID=428712 RepID=UPI0001B91219|nr:tripartite tricarboxylate transporter substrate binding protein [Jonquetella anthropi]EEX49258.1 hypothetical protein GCWU000246_00346 [Jonquetella anthropi E3_33 E1]
MQIRKAVCRLLAAAGILSLGGACYGAYPEKPVEVIVAFQPGGGTDVAARTVFKFAEKYFGQSYAIVNKPGASGEIGWTAIARGNPDGYTIGFINPPGFLIIPIQRPAAKYRLDNFDLIANIVMDPGVIGVRPDSPYKTLNDLIEAEKKEPGKISIAYSGPGTSEALLLSRVERQSGVTLNKVPFDGSAPGMVALMGGHVEAVCMNLSECYTYIDDGNLRLVGVGSPEREATVPDVPTYKEQGYDFIQASLRGVAAPKGLPKEALQAIENSLKKAVEDPEFQAKTKELQMPLRFMGSEEYTKFLNDMNQDLQKEWETNPW